MPVIGVTGSFGSGKSVVAGMFAKRGARVFDADKAVHALLTGNGPTVKAIGKQFGLDVVNGNGVDRKTLGSIVFDSPLKLKQLMAILHPRVKREAQKFIRANADCAWLVLDVPLLIESGWENLVDIVLVVFARREQQYQRVNQRSGITRREAAKRIRCQMPVKEKLKCADYRIDNSGTLKTTDKQVHAIISDLEKVNSKRKVSIKQCSNRREV